MKYIRIHYGNHILYLGAASVEWASVQSNPYLFLNPDLLKMCKPTYCMEALLPLVCVLLNQGKGCKVLCTS